MIRTQVYIEHIAGLQAHIDSAEKEMARRGVDVSQVKPRFRYEANPIGASGVDGRPLNDPILIIEWHVDFPADIP